MNLAELTPAQIDAMPAINACPFCGSSDVHVLNNGTPYYMLGAWEMWVTCYGCRARGPLATHQGIPQGTSRETIMALKPAMERAAIELWNRGVATK